MADFSNIKQRYTISEETLAEYTFHQIEGEPSVWCAPATDANKPFQNERLRLGFEESERLEAEAKKAGPKKSEKLTAEKLVEQLDADRDTNRQLMARCCAKKWGTAPATADGKPPEASEADFQAWADALPDDMFDSWFNWASNPYNFRNRPTSTAGADALGNA